MKTVKQKTFSFTGIAKPFAGMTMVNLLLVCLLHSCVHNTDIPLHNSIPQIAGFKTNDSVFHTDSIVTRALTYPDSTVCTLFVNDLNDSILSFRAKQQNDTSWDTSWGYEMLHSTLNEKQMVIFSRSKSMNSGTPITGTWIISDGQNAQAQIGYAIIKELNFIVNRATENHYWKTEGDSEYVNILQGELTEFVFEKDSDSTALKKAEIVSTFGIKGDMACDIGYSLKDQMNEGFTMAFVLSTDSINSDSGETAGIYFQGDNNQFKGYIKVDTTTYPFATKNDYYDGIVKFEHTTHFIKMYYRSDPTTPVITRLSNGMVLFEPKKSVYLHIWMSANGMGADLRKYCYITNIDILKGDLEF